VVDQVTDSVQVRANRATVRVRLVGNKVVGSKIVNTKLFFFFLEVSFLLLSRPRPTCMSGKREEAVAEEQNHRRESDRPVRLQAE
jgi:hypothetical protein